MTVSSGYKNSFALVFILTRSFKYILNRRGTRTIPCSTPHLIPLGLTPSEAI